MADKRDFDLVIFGATGFTGFYMVRELLLTIEEKPAEYGTLKWAVAGRSLTKLDDTLSRLAQELNIDLSRTVKIKADVNDAASLKQMAQRTTLVVNVVGPYKFFGHQVVEACVAAGTHHIDISGELVYIEGTQIEFDAKAQETGSLIISTCGFDSVPNDIGVAFLKDHFEGKLHSVESFVRIHPGPKGYTINYGTLHSAMYIITDFLSYLRVHSRLYAEVLTKKLPQNRLRLSSRLIPFTRPQVPGWNVLFVGCDQPTVERTQHYNYEHFNESPVQFRTYFNVSRFIHLIGIAILGAIVGMFGLFRPGRYILEKYLERITLGFFSKAGPTREQVNTTRFTTTLFGKGWSKESRLDEGDPHSEPSIPPNKEMTVVVSGRDPGYVATSIAAIQAGLTIVKEREKMPKGGVLTPASAFRNTKLVERYQSRGLKFDIIFN